METAKEMLKLSGCALGIAAAIVLAGVYIFMAGFDESRYFGRYSVDYYILVESELVKNFPVPDRAVKVMYHSSCGDGPKPPSNAVQFEVDGSDQTYLEEIQRFLNQSQLSHTPRGGAPAVSDSKTSALPPLLDGSTDFLDQHGNSVELSISRVGDSHRIFLEHSYR